MMIQCPHCFRRIMPYEDGTCPACHADTNDLTGVDPDRVSLTIHEKSKLPSVCCTCAEFTNHIVRVSRSRQLSTSTGEGGGMLIPAMSILFGGCFGILAAMLAGDSDTASATVLVPVRQCKSCAKTEPLDPIFVNFDVFEMEFVVHRDFAEQFRELNAKPSRP